MRTTEFKDSRIQGLKGNGNRRAPLNPRTFKALNPSRPAAFTIVELIVVITIIALLLALAVPGLSRMATEAKFSSTIQAINGTLTRAHYAALSDRTLVAVRFVAGAWDVDKDGQVSEAPDRQYAVTYQYACATEDRVTPTKVLYSERFERRKNSTAVELPPGMWVAPIEAYTPGALGEEVLKGPLGRFELDANNTNFMKADDFLVVFDPQTGVRLGPRSPDRQTWPRYSLLAPDLTAGQAVRESEQIRRHNFSGIVLYERDPLRALGATGPGIEKKRQDLLRRTGRPYFVHRFSGALVMGNQETK